MSFLGWNHLSSTLLGGRRRQPAAPGPTVPAPAPTTTNPINHLLPRNDANGNATTRDKKTLDPLFGPNIGAVTSGPAWTASVDKKIVTDDLTPDVVTSWIEKSRDQTQPTTTLQALVNLKRPTIKLSPLHLDSEDSDHSQPHGLEFEYDCDAPKCGLYVHVYLPKSHPDAPPAPPHHSYAKLLVFESVVDGGFGKHLRLDEGAVLELGHFEHIPPSPAEEPSSAIQVATPSEEPQAAVTASQETGTTARQRRRFTALRFRRGHSTNRSISGPALAVVDAEPQGAAQEGAEAKKETKTETEDGVKVVIRLAALDDQGTELANINEQITYLHIVRLGPKPEGAEDTRPWVVKVVKREATIGPHTFHLHEIYGLTSTSTSKPTPAAATYPPTDTPGDLDDDPQSECLLCLSSPREVVLLPCRHLVACKECALNMVEFGAGGNITQSEGTAASPAGAGGDEGGGVGANAGDGVTAAPTPAGGVTITVNGVVNARRKRKAKGWFCPVCRQPYTSLLRITTAPPSVDESKESDLDPTTPGGAIDTLPTLGSLSLSDPNRDANATSDTSGRSGGILGLVRPTFLRTLTGGGRTGNSGTGGQQTPQPAVEMTEEVGSAGRRPVPLDVESTAGMGRVGS